MLNYYIKIRYNSITNVGLLNSIHIIIIIKIYKINKLYVKSNRMWIAAISWNFTTTTIKFNC